MDREFTSLPALVGSCDLLKGNEVLENERNKNSG